MVNAFLENAFLENVVEVIVWSENFCLVTASLESASLVNVCLENFSQMNALSEIVLGRAFLERALHESAF